MTPQADRELVNSMLFNSAYTKLENVELYSGNWIIRNNNQTGTTTENYKISKPIELKEGEEIYFLWYGNITNGHRAIGLADNPNSPVTSVVGIVPADTGIDGFSNTMYRLVSYKATCDCYVVLCRHGFDSDTPIYKCELTYSTLKERLGNEVGYIFDLDNGYNIINLFVNGQINKTFVIRYQHNLGDASVTIPAGCTILFLGGSITNGKITFNQTSLQGNVNLKGCAIYGTVANEIFNAAWVCMCNGTTDDAPNLQKIINCCKHVLLQDGTYQIGSTLSINKSYFVLEGVGNAVLKSKDLGLNTPRILDIIPVSYAAGQVTNVTIKGVTFQMVNNFTESYYASNKGTLQFKQAITAKGVNHLTIQNCTFKRIIGDGIYLGLYEGGSPTLHNQNVTIIDNTFDGEGTPSRNGVSVIDGNTVWIKDNNIDNITAACMPGAIDIEPNYTTSQIENIHVEGNHINRSRGNVAAIALVIGSNACTAHNVHFSGNDIQFTPSMQGYNPKAFFFRLRSATECSNIIVSENTIGNNLKEFVFDGDTVVKNLVLSNNIVS